MHLVVAFIYWGSVWLITAAFLGAYLHNDLQREVRSICDATITIAWMATTYPINASDGSLLVASVFYICFALLSPIVASIVRPPRATCEELDTARKRADRAVQVLGDDIHSSAVRGIIHSYADQSDVFDDLCSRLGGRCKLEIVPGWFRTVHIRVRGVNADSAMVGFNQWTKNIYRQDKGFIVDCVHDQRNLAYIVTVYLVRREYVRYCVSF